jgi:hypothetical protein
MTAQRRNVIVPQQQQKMKPRSLPNSTLDHANQNGFHLPHDPLAGANNGNRTPKNFGRMSHIEHTRKLQQNSPVRYNPGKFFFNISILEEIFLVYVKNVLLRFY